MNKINSHNSRTQCFPWPFPFIPTPNNSCPGSAHTNSSTFKLCHHASCLPSHGAPTIPPFLSLKGHIDISALHPLSQDCLYFRLVQDSLSSKGWPRASDPPASEPELWDCVSCATISSLRDACDQTQGFMHSRRTHHQLSYVLGFSMSSHRPILSPFYSAAMIAVLPFLVIQWDHRHLPTHQDQVWGGFGVGCCRHWISGDKGNFSLLWEVVKVISLRHFWTPSQGVRKYFLPWLLSTFHWLTRVSKTCQSILFQTLGHRASRFQLESSFEHLSLVPSLISIWQHPRNIISSYLN